MDHNSIITGRADNVKEGGKDVKIAGGKHAMHKAFPRTIPIFLGGRGKKVGRREMNCMRKRYGVVMYA